MGALDMVEASRIGTLLQTLDPQPPLSPGEKARLFAKVERVIAEAQAEGAAPY